MEKGKFKTISEWATLRKKSCEVLSSFNLTRQSVMETELRLTGNCNANPPLTEKEFNLKMKVTR